MENNVPINIFDVANYIIDRIPNITNMKLQKLIYYSQKLFVSSCFI
ncbi:hypothetical protein LFWB_6810 [Candidatus Phytoplasma luffae]|uniref:Uncharacterized protein n=1 Tax=Loofah witches'-broom phytoplasma TaxID=35773 RepID=A0A975FJL3_LOWBP|nr:hypothetical protein LFWB_6810 [Candidatus Phytoplasma luffae]